MMPYCERLNAVISAKGDWRRCERNTRHEGGEATGDLGGWASAGIATNHITTPALNTDLCSARVSLMIMRRLKARRLSRSLQQRP